MGSFKYTNQAYKLWLERTGRVRTTPTHGYNSKKSINKARAKKAKQEARKQAYKDMAEVLPKVNAFEDPYFDTWDISRSKVFSPEQEKLNKELTFK